MILPRAFLSLQVAESNYSDPGLQLCIFRPLLLASGHWAWQSITFPEKLLIYEAAVKHQNCKKAFYLKRVTLLLLKTSKIQPEDSYLEAVLEMMELPAGTERWWWPRLPQCVKGEPRWEETEVELNLYSQGKQNIPADERNK